MEEKTQEKEIRYSKLSLEELKELAEQGDAKAQNSFANLYCYGKDVKKDYKKAVKWYSKSAVQGNAVAQNNLARCYQKGFGVEKDLVKALEWANKAAENGDEKAKVTVQDIRQEMNELSPHLCNH